MPIIEVATRVLSSTAFGNLILLVAALVGVGGNYWLYLRKRANRAEILRQSLYAEIESMESPIREMDKQHDVVTMDPIDPRSFLINSVYEASSDDLGLLSEEEVTAVVEFYSTATSIQRVIGDDFATAYEQVARRDLYTKLRRALEKLDAASQGGIEQIEPDQGDVRDIPTV